MTHRPPGYHAAADWHDRLAAPLWERTPHYGYAAVATFAKRCQLSALPGGDGAAAPESRNSVSRLRSVVAATSLRRR